MLFIIQIEIYYHPVQNDEDQGTQNTKFAKYYIWV
jgi:hypothetical protein